MKTLTSIKKRCKECIILYRKGRLYRVCKIRKHKAHQ